MKTAAVFGTFDVANYGDCLFPLLTRWRLERLGFDVVPVSPTSSAVPWRDALRPMAVEAFMRGERPVDAVLVGGGSIIHRSAVKLPDYQQGNMRAWAYLSLWLGAALAASTQEVPLIWNAPGVPLPFDADAPPAVPLAISAASYLSVRDAASAANLPEGFAPAIMPDSAVEVAQMWPRESLTPVFRDMLAQSGLDAGSRVAVFHAKARAVQAEGEEAVAARIATFCRDNGVVPALVAIGPCHGDDTLAASLGERIGGALLLLDRARELREIAALIAHAEVFVGASLHGYITAFSYCVPAVLVAQPAIAKFDGFLGHAGRKEDAVGSWEQAMAAAAERLGKRGPAFGPSPALLDAVEAHWARIADALASSPSEKQRQFMAAYLRDRMSADGIDAALLPFVAPRRRKSAA
ncbi:polysaccharide pyruvyl transferase family protein [Sphingomonas sp. ID0503]|uniref:polysaccharide pyruvyl transferase family protein n=1 Tax=Sphingomonas sp. ID0503 TaxID=3399691 RepID=UPI003AFA5BF3